MSFALRQEGSAAHLSRSRPGPAWPELPHVGIDLTDASINRGVISTLESPKRSVACLSVPTLNDAEELLAFERSNRAYFEQWINARDPGYYDLAAVREAITLADEQRRADAGYQFLVRWQGDLVGRVNLSAVMRPFYNKASLGYRIGERHAGRGLATQAVALALAEGFGRLGLWRIEASVRPDNLGSVRVLQGNGFTACGRATRCFLLHGQWHDLLQFECHAARPGQGDECVADAISTISD